MPLLDDNESAHVRFEQCTASEMLMCKALKYMVFENLERMYSVSRKGDISSAGCQMEAGPTETWKLLLYKDF